MNDPSFRSYLSDHPLLAANLPARIKKEQDERRLQVSEGYATDYADYRERIGVIKGLQVAIQLCEQLNRELQER